MANKNLMIITKIIAYYCVFYIGVKAYGIYTGMWFLPNLVIIGVLIVPAITGWFIIRKKKYNWTYVVLGILLVTLLRAYEIRIVNYLYENF